MGKASRGLSMAHRPRLPPSPCMLCKDFQFLLWHMATRAACLRNYSLCPPGRKVSLVLPGSGTSITGRTSPSGAPLILSFLQRCSYTLTLSACLSCFSLLPSFFSSVSQWDSWPLKQLTSPTLPLLLTFPFSVCSGFLH